MKTIDTKEILKILKGSRKPLGFQELLSHLGIQRKDSKFLKRALRKLISEGKVILNRKGRYCLPEEIRLIRGIFEAHRDGYGFLIPEAPGEKDLFIPPRSTGGAMGGDLVIARLENEKKREGRILRVLERAQKTIVGVMEPSGNAFYVKPTRRDIPFEIYIDPRDRGKAKAGSLVKVEITTFPTDTRPPAGKVIKVLKKPTTPAEEVELILEEYNLPRRFPKQVSAEAKTLSQDAIAEALKGRKDLRNLKTVTIDGESAKDFDDAISIKLRKFGYTIYIHIADVSHFVREGSDIDREARKRATSVYLPDRVIPMLPKKLSEDLCSLKPKVPRLAFTVEMDFSRDGERLRERFYPSIIESNERMTYTDVKAILIDYDRDLRKKYNSLLRDFELMAELCNILRKRRMDRGSLDFDLPEPEVLLDLRGNPEKIIASERNFAHMLIEEFMIAANEAVAEFLHSKGVPSIYRVHEGPDPEKIQVVLKIIQGLMGEKRRILVPENLPEIISHFHGKSEEDVVNYMILRTLKQARYSPQNIGHFGLASRCYTHFTSPIRRYPDLVVHRILRELTAGKKPGKKRSQELEETLPAIAFHSSKMERLADNTERTVIDAMRIWFMKDRLGDEFQARVIGVNRQGLRIRLKEFYVEGFLHVSYMTDDYYIFDEDRLILFGKRTRRRFTIGDTLTVRVDRLDTEEREVVFGLPEA